MEFEDKQIICQDCGQEFTHTAEDQMRYADRGFTEAPKRCRECRQARKERAAAGREKPEGRRSGGQGRGSWGGGRGEGQGFRQDRRGGSGPRGRRGGSQGRPQRQSYAAVCAACGASTTVPFEPTPGRDVFCKACFQKLREER